MSDACTPRASHTSRCDTGPRCFTTLSTPYVGAFTPLSTTHGSCASSDWKRRRYNPVRRNIAVRLSGAPVAAGGPSERSKERTVRDMGRVYTAATE
jgi:hypothetical protein